MVKVSKNYLFGDFLGQAMSKVSLQVQLESGMMSMAFMMIGLIVTGIYLAVYMVLPLWYKIFLIINLFAGLIFFMSNLTTLFQQYQNYLEVKDFQNNQKEVN